MEIDCTLSGSKKYLDKYTWKCTDYTCKRRKNIRKGNKILENFPKIKLKFLLEYIFSHFCMLIPASTSHKVLGLSLSTIKRLSGMVSEWLIEEQISSENSMQFGGENTIIELDESCFFKRKSNKGRARKNIWVFGFVERISGRFFAEVVQKRDANTLIPIIENG